MANLVTVLAYLVLGNERWRGKTIKMTILPLLRAIVTITRIVRSDFWYHPRKLNDTHFRGFHLSSLCSDGSCWESTSLSSNEGQSECVLTELCETNGIRDVMPWVMTITSISISDDGRKTKFSLRDCRAVERIRKRQDRVVQIWF